MRKGTTNKIDAQKFLDFLALKVPDSAMRLTLTGSDTHTVGDIVFNLNRHLEAARQDPARYAGHQLLFNVDTWGLTWEPTS